MKLEPGDFLVVVIYFAVMIFIGFYLARRKERREAYSFEEFLLAGRKVTLPLFISTLVATWYGNILGIGEFVYRSGIVAWVCFGLPYYVAAAVFAVFMAKKIRSGSARTIPEQIGLKFGGGAGIVSSIIVLVITIPAAYILMLGVIIQIFIGWNLWLCIILGSALSVGYLFTGGLKADILTNTAQFILMYAGFALLLGYCIIKFGLPTGFAGKLPADHLSFFGGFSWQIIISWFIISLQTFVDPSFHQRCAAARTPATAQRGILISILFWALFDFLTLMTGLYAKSFIHINNPVMAYPALGDAILPPILKGIFIVAMLATIMSTLDSYAFISAATIGHDIINPIRHKIKRFMNVRSENLVRIGLLLTAIIGIFMAAAIPSAVDLIYRTASVAIPGLLIPLVISYSRNYRLGSAGAVIIMTVSSLVSLAWTILKYGLTGNNQIFGIFAEFEPMIPGIFVSFLLGLVFIRKAS